MARQEKLNNVVAGVVDDLRRRAHHHALADRHGASGLQAAEVQSGAAVLLEHNFAGLPVAHRCADLHQTHAAHADRLHFRMVAKDRDIDANFLGRVHNQGTRGYLDFFSINL